VYFQIDDAISAKAMKMQLDLVLSDHEQVGAALET
jgi:hypothetical protein